ncbi:Tissue factor pathway inhibitor [Portunus trituberculatus]|uniref:Tissue factor pathway inhibitor n=1 Tax=Portunus trituberculatus TaxID=210409 RepID=A0A5B7D120_PORTR|nr:Tissue factor pathway inhibitor [Portunus trituberculatus]
MRPEPGLCDPVLKWYYDLGSGRCSQFFSTHCGQSHNTFDYKEVCETMCGFLTTSTTVTPATPVPLLCYMKWDAGTCRGADLKYYYAPKAGTCIPLYYSGCGGNDNRFDSMEECLHVCGRGNTTTTDATSTTTTTTTAARSCPSEMLICPLDCGIKYIIDFDTNCPRCVCDVPTSVSPCPSEFSICPTYCPVVVVTDPLTKCRMCVCNPVLPPPA